MISGEGEEIPFFKMLKARKLCVSIDSVGNVELAQRPDNIRTLMAFPVLSVVIIGGSLGY